MRNPKTDSGIILRRAGSISAIPIDLSAAIEMRHTRRTRKCITDAECAAQRRAAPESKKKKGTSRLVVLAASLSHRHFFKARKSAH